MTMKKEPLVPWRMVEATAILLFWLQAMRVLFSVLFGVIYDTLFDAELSFAVVGIIFVFVLAALLAPAVSPRDSNKGRMGLFIAVLVAAVARAPLTINDPWLRLAGAIVVVGATGIYLALLLRRRGEMVPVVLVLALLVDQLARAYGDTWDATLQPGFLPVQIVLCLALIGVAWTVYSRPPDSDRSRSVRSRSGRSRSGRSRSGRSPDRAPLGVGGGLALGGFLFLQTAVLAQPHVLARWTGVAYEWTAPALLLLMALPLFFITNNRFQLYGGRPLQELARWGVLARGGLLLGGVLLGLAIGRHLGGILALAALLLAQLLLLLALPLPLARPSSAEDDRSGLALALGMVCFFVLHLLFAFAFTYPYTIPAFRGAGSIILLMAAALAILPAALRPPDATSPQPAPVNNHLVVLFSFVLMAVFMWSDPGPPAVREPDQAVRVATYNIHYGYNTDWEYSLNEQARAIEQSRADIVFLQEVDAGRITSYGVDNALWLARRLGMQAVFAPTLEGLSGIALLTRLPLAESDWVLLPSELEQTAMVHARLGELDVYGVWLGLEEQERMNQVAAALDIIGAAELAFLGGDMNSEPDSAVYMAVRSAGFVDPFVVTGNLPAFTAPAVNPGKRIDYVWARGLEPVDAWVSPSLASDHRLVVVEWGVGDGE